MGLRKRVWLQLCWQVRCLGVQSKVFWFLSLWKGMKGEVECVIDMG